MPITETTEKRFEMDITDFLLSSAGLLTLSFYGFSIPIRLY